MSEGVVTYTDLQWIKSGDGITGSFHVTKTHEWPTHIEFRNDTLRPRARKRNVFEVERILEKKLIDGKFKYLIKWFGYPIDESTWVPEKKLKCKEALAHFNDQQSVTVKVEY